MANQPVQKTKLISENYVRDERSRYNTMRVQLDNERSSFMTHWRTLGDYILPRRPRFTVTDVNKGDRRNQLIVNATATLAARTLQSGMMGGITSPARPWFKLTTADQDLAEFSSVKDWLYQVTQRMQTAFIRSNLYNTLPLMYGDLGVFGTSAMFIEEDLEDGIRTYPFGIGSYMISNNAKLKVDVFMREFSMTVRQIVEKFGVIPGTNDIDWTNISTYIKNLWDEGNYETWITVCHLIMPNERYDPMKLESKFKRYKSVYYELGSQGATAASYLNDDDNSKYLRKSGFDIFPVLAPRWEINGEDAYGTNCPGMIALGDVKQLQLAERKAMQAIEKMVNPPMVAPVALRTGKVSILPGDVTYDSTADGKGFRPAFQIDPRINELQMKNQQIEQRISRIFFEDLFLMLANSDRRDITATEINERKEEKLLALGPVLEQLNQDLLDPLIDNTFHMLNNQGQFPQPPDEMQGVPLKIEYISVMSQAQKLVAIGGIDRFTGFVGNLVANTQNPEILDKVNTDKLVDAYADITSVPPEILRTEEEVTAIRQGRQKAQASAQAAQTAKDASSSVKNLASADMSGENALTNLLAQAKAGAIPGTIAE